MTALRLFALDVTDNDERWQEQALCSQTDPEAFFPEKGGSTKDGKRTCMACDVRLECLLYAVDRDERFGIWGGLSPDERRLWAVKTPQERRATWPGLA